jgi:hypothetical protein
MVAMVIIYVLQKKSGGGVSAKTAYFTTVLQCNIWPYVKRHLRRPHLENSRVRKIFIGGCGNLKVRCSRDLQWLNTKFGKNRSDGSGVWRGQKHTQTQHGELIMPATCHSEGKFGYELFTSKSYDFFFTSFFLSFLFSLLLPTHSTCRGLLLHLITLNDTRAHKHTPHLVGLLWTSDWHIAETPTWQHTTFTSDRHLHLRRWETHAWDRAATRIGPYDFDSYNHWQPILLVGRSRPWVWGR